MTLTTVPRMAKMGRPRKEDGDSGTTLLRVHDDLAVLITDLALVLPKTTAQIIDSAAREPITLLHEKYKTQIEKVKAAHQAAAEAVRVAREEAQRMTSSDKPTSRKPPKPGT